MLNVNGDYIHESYEDFINKLLCKYINIIIPYPNSLFARNKNLEYDVYINRNFHCSCKGSVEAKEYILKYFGKRYNDLLFFKEKDS